MSSIGRTRQFLTKNWISISGVFIGVIGLGLSFYFYRLSVAERAPVLIVDPARTKIIDSQSFPNSALKVLRNDNSPIASDITAIRFYFWNNGTASIKQENVLQPLLLALTDQGAEILDYKILKVSRPDVVLPNLSRDEKDQSKRLLLSFKILEANDGFTGQIIFSGNSSADLHLSGVVEGVKDIETNVTLSRTQFWKALGFFGLVPHRNHSYLCHSCRFYGQSDRPSIWGRCCPVRISSQQVEITCRTLVHCDSPCSLLWQS
jgi:hypothetical protein